MSRYTLTFRCAEPGGCRESVTYGYDRRADQNESYARNSKAPWKCTRHADPGAWLCPGNEQTTFALVATRLPSGIRDDDWLPGLYWIPDGGTTGSGYTFGPGFSAKAAEFPEGTRLTVTTRIEMP